MDKIFKELDQSNIKISLSKFDACVLIELLKKNQNEHDKVHLWSFCSKVETQLNEEIEDSVRWLRYKHKYFVLYLFTILFVAEFLDGSDEISASKKVITYLLFGPFIVCIVLLIGFYFSYLFQKK